MRRWLLQSAKVELANTTDVAVVATSNCSDVDCADRIDVDSDGDCADTSGSENIDSDLSENDEDNVVKPKRKKYEIHFRNEWKRDHPWIEEDSSIKQGKKCTVCNVGIFGNLNHIQRHGKSEMHKKREITAGSSLKLSNFFNNNSEENKLNNAAKDLEMRLSLFVAAHNLPFTCLDHLTKCLKTVKDSKTISRLSLNRLKGQKNITFVTGPENCNNLSEITTHQYYSIIIDESTDLTTSKNLAVVIRIYNKKCQDRFLDMVPVINSTAAAIFDALINLLNLRKIPLEKLLGFTADNCNVMMGKKNSVQTKLKEICPHLFVSGDICHNLNLASEAAASVLPKCIDKLMFKKLIQKFCHSASRKGEFIQLQEYFESQVHVILRLCTTRWLSREAVVNRLLEKWSTLQYYFNLVCFETGNGNESNQFIYDTLCDKKTKIIFYFLSYILKMINDINREMQHEDARIHVLLPRIEFLFKQICRNFIDKEKLDNCTIFSIDLNDHVPLSNIYCGTDIEIYMIENDVGEIELNECKTLALKFYVKFCEELRKRVDFNNFVLKAIPLFEPKHVVSGKTNSILNIIAKLFPKAEMENAKKINAEYRALADFSEVNYIKDLNISQFWWEVSKFRNELNELLFPNIFRIVQGILSLPHSSACEERIFSIQNLIKTKCRNRLALPTCSSLIQTKDLMRTGDTCCFNYNTKNLMTYTLPNKDLTEEQLIMD